MNTPQDDRMRSQKQWTLMFYFASDGPLAPHVVAQLKAIKNAGFHRDVNVVVKFDPQTSGMPTHIFDVNLFNKLKQPEDVKSFRFKDDDPYVRSLVLDKLWGRREFVQPIREGIRNLLGNRAGCGEYDPPIPDSEVADEFSNFTEPSPKKSLNSFLQFCAKEYPAQHYMLFLLGHGLAVGNRMFLYDADAEQPTLSIGELTDILDNFKETTFEQAKSRDWKKGELELIAFHSCSMSSLELAYELQGRANFMLASQGPNFVEGYPYKQIVTRVLNAEDQRTNRLTPQQLIEKIFRYIVCNHFDFQLAGYSFDLALCDLRQTSGVRVWLAELSRLLTEGLTSKDKNPLVADLILLSHWEAQSYWQESYTDLYDFCFCLQRRCESHRQAWERQEGYRTVDPGPTQKLVRQIEEACEELIKILTPACKGESKVIVRSEFAGPEYQYSHGLSVYFPWSEPADQIFWRREYPAYKFEETGWRKFLQQYFELTRRKPVWEEIKYAGEPSVEQDLLERMTLPFTLVNAEAMAGNGKAGGASALAAIGDKPGGASTLDTAPEKPGGSSTLDLSPEKPGGSSTLDLSPEKPGGSSTLDLSPEKPGGSSTLAGGDNKPGGGSALGNGSSGHTSMLDKAGPRSALEKPGGSSATGGNCDCGSIKNHPKRTRSLPPRTTASKRPQVWPTSPDYISLMREDYAKLIKGNGN